MKILFIAPIPPPINGQSLAAGVFANSLKINHRLNIIDTTKNDHKDGITSFKRIVEVISILFKTMKNKKGADIIYLHISESIAGNIKDLLTYCICYFNLSNMYIHLHGGSLEKLVFNKFKLLKIINKFFISKLGGVIILGESHSSMFEGMIYNKKLHIVPNFAEDYLFINDLDFNEKFKTLTPLKILFMSNLIEGKGYNELLDAYLALDNDEQEIVTVDFAGGFSNESDKSTFLEKIKHLNNVKYHGIVNGNTKAELFNKSHIFCLPTSYNEGQPISILEAYASGCVVLTTLKGGIVDIFENKINGYAITDKSSSAIVKSIRMSLKEKDRLIKIAIHNKEIAQIKYKLKSHIDLLSQTINII